MIKRKINMCKHLKAIILDDVGTTVVEYALIVSVVAFVVVIAAILFGKNLLAIYETFNI